FQHREVTELFGRHTFFDGPQVVIAIDDLDVLRHDLTYLHALSSSVIALQMRCYGAVCPYPGAKPMPAAREHRGHLLYGLPCPRGKVTQPRLRLGAYVRLLTLCHRHETRCQATSRLRHPSSVHVVDA